MTKNIIFPRLGQLLRTLITGAGYRGFIVNIGLEKDLDDLANESRPGSVSDLMKAVEDACIKELALDCGVEFAQFLGQAWFRTREAIQQLVQNVDTSPLANEQGQELVLRLFGVPMLSGFIRLATSRRAGPDIDCWWESPFSAWVQYASLKAGISSDDLVTNLANYLDADPRSIDRWMDGEATGKLSWPYRPMVSDAIGKNAESRLGTGGVDQISGWLMIAVAFQSLAPDLREHVRRDYNLRPQQPWSLGAAARAMISQGFDHGNRPIKASAIPLLQKIEQLFASQPRNAAAIQTCLKDFQTLILQENPLLQCSYQYIHHWFSARLAAIAGNEDDALRLYDAAVSAVWWYGGANQHPIINEALVYAVGVGKKVAADHYWDKTYLLGLNSGCKYPLDEQELRRLAFGFEKMFFPQKAKDRIPPRIEFIVRDEDFRLSPQQLANPNRKVKFAEGRTRRTPLMDAICEGTLDDVKKVIEAGGDPNDFIKESGEGPLSYAMRRACDRKDTAIMEFLLSLDLLPDTVNRPASTMRETPLKIAIEMANAAAVERLIAVGADVERACDYVPSALCYVMSLLHGSIHRGDLAQESAYLAGKGRADVYDAKDGAVLNIDLAARRQSLLALRSASDRRQQIFDAVKNYFIRPAADHRQVIQVLLRHGADANRRYKVEAHDLAEWTPTLFAAQVGDIDVFKMLVEHAGVNRGDPDLTLMQSSALERFDALWVAVDHGRHTIVSYLMERLQQR